jgi:hypothetical protein
VAVNVSEDLFWVELGLSLLLTDRCELKQILLTEGLEQVAGLVADLGCADDCLSAV